jgi:hypothetical protein
LRDSRYFVKKQVPRAADLPLLLKAWQSLQAGPT